MAPLTNSHQRFQRFDLIGNEGINASIFSHLRCLQTEFSNFKSNDYLRFQEMKKPSAQGKQERD